MSAGLKGNVDLGHIKLGAYRFFIAPWDTGFSEEEPFNTEDPPYPWKDLGLSANESAMRFGVNMFQLRAGIPMLRKKNFIIEREAEMDIILEEFSGANMARSLWHTGVAIKNIAGTPAAEEAVAVTNVLGSTEYVIQASPAPTATEFELDSVTGLSVGDVIVAEAVTGDLADSVNRGVIAAIDVDTLLVTLTAPLPSAPASTWVVRRVTASQVEVADGTTWTVDQYVALALAELDLPESADEFKIVSIAGDILKLSGIASVTLIGLDTWIGQIMSYKIPFGGGSTVKCAILAVFDDLDGGQYIVFMRRAEVKGDFSLALQANSENMKIPLTVMGTKFDDEAEDTVDALLATLHIFKKRE